MFCTKCGKEIQTEWKNCPNCGATLKEHVEEQQSKDTDSRTLIPRGRDEIKAELLNDAFSEKGGVIIFYGAGSISKDMANLLNAGEEMIAFYHAHRNSIIGQLKSLRMFRNYIVCTNQRILYIERGSMVFSLIPFIKKTISVPYQEILNVAADKRLGIYSGKLIIEDRKRKINFAMMDRKSAEQLQGFLSNKK